MVSTGGTAFRLRSEWTDSRTLQVLSPPGLGDPGGNGTFPPSISDQTLWQVYQTKLKDQALLEGLQECRADPNLDCLDCLSTVVLP
jgi:hypothetical protein